MSRVGSCDAAPPPRSSHGSLVAPRCRREPDRLDAPSGAGRLAEQRLPGRPAHLVPIWFSWDGATILVASKPNAKKVANLRHNPSVMLALGEPEDDFDVGMVRGIAELPAEPAADLLPPAHLAKYRDQMRAIGLTWDEFLATYSQVIRIRPTRFLPWHGRTTPAGADLARPTGDRRLAAAIRRVAAGLETRPVRVGTASLAS